MSTYFENHQSIYMASADIFKALADPNRRRILKLLQGGSMTAGAIAESFTMTKGTLSHHFKVLKETGLVRCERRGQQIVYAINTSVFEDVAALMLDLFKTGKTGDAPAED